MGRGRLADVVGLGAGIVGSGEVFHSPVEKQAWVSGTSSRPRRGWTLRDAGASFRIIFYKDAFAVLWMVASCYSVHYTFQVAIPVIFDEAHGYNELT